MATCPHCQNNILQLRLNPVQGHAPNGSSWNCLVLSCPNCNAALGADIDLTAIRADIIAAVKQA